MRQCSMEQYRQVLETDAPARRRVDGGLCSLGAAHSMIGPLTDQQRRRAEGELSTRAHVRLFLVAITLFVLRSHFRIQPSMGACHHRSPTSFMRPYTATATAYYMYSPTKGTCSQTCLSAFFFSLFRSPETVALSAFMPSRKVRVQGCPGAFG